MTDLPRAGETWERVRDGRRVEVASVFAPRVFTWHPKGTGQTSHRLHEFRREFRRVTLSDGREG